MRNWAGLRVAVLTTGILCLAQFSYASGMKNEPVLQLQDEGSSQGDIKRFNCVGSTVACTASNGTGTATFTGGGGSANINTSDVATVPYFVTTTTVTGDVSHLWHASPNTLSISADAGQSGNALAIVVSNDTGTRVFNVSHDGSVFANKVQVSNDIAVVDGGTGLSSGTSGGVLAFTGTTTLASSVLLSADAVLVGGGSGVAPRAISPHTTTTHALFATAGAPAFRALVTTDVTGVFDVDTTTNLRTSSPLSLASTGLLTASIATTDVSGVFDVDSATNLRGGTLATLTSAGVLNVAVATSDVTGVFDIPVDTNLIAQDEGTSVTQRSIYNYTGAGVSVADTGGKTTITISGAGSPAGSNGNIQYNSASSFAGDGALNWDSSGNTLSISRDASQTGYALRISGDLASQGVLANISHDGGAFFSSLAVGSTSGFLTSASGTVTKTTMADDQIFIASSPTAGAATSMPDCDDTGGQHLNYDTTTNTPTCGTSSGSTGGWTDNTTAINLTTNTYNVGVGSPAGTSLGKMSVSGDTNENILVVRGVNGQTATTFVIQSNDASTIFSVSNDGSVSSRGDGVGSMTLGTGQAAQTTYIVSADLATGDNNITFGPSVATFSNGVDVTGSLEVPNGASPTVDALGEVAVDTTANQLVVGLNSTTVFATQSWDTVCYKTYDLTAADDNTLMYLNRVAAQVVAVGCGMSGDVATLATIALTDGAGNAMTHTAPTCVSGDTSMTFQSVTANNALTAGERLTFSVTNTPTSTTNEYLICTAITETRQ